MVVKHVCPSTLSHLNRFSTGAEWSKGPVKHKSPRGSQGVYRVYSFGYTSDFHRSTPTVHLIVERCAIGSTVKAVFFAKYFIVFYDISYECNQCIPLYANLCKPRCTLMEL